MPIKKPSGETEFPNVSATVKCDCGASISMRNYGSPRVSINCWKCARWVEFYISTSGGLSCYISGPNQPPRRIPYYNYWSERKKKPK